MEDREQLDQLHCLTQLLQGIEVGLIVIDRDYHVHLWNGFMENHSGFRNAQVLGKSLFESFPELPQEWLISKLESAFLLESRSFTVWEQRPWVFPFPNSRPITGGLEKMHQNMTIQPLRNSHGQISHAALIIYDVSVQAQDSLMLAQANEQLQQLSQVDGLTGLTNRRQWDLLIGQEFNRSKRYNQESCLLVIDIDYFKKVNDQRGHDIGDEVLKGMAQLLKQQLRESDIVARYGGEEFVVMLPNTSLTQAKELAERIRLNVEAHVFDVEPPLSVTISSGLCEYRPTLSDTQDWFKLADQALYLSKSNGRNQVTIAE